MNRLLLSLLVVIFLATALSACKAATPTPPPLPQYTSWQYTTLVLVCEADRETSSLVCRRTYEEDLTMMDNVLNQMGAQGWELVSIFRSEAQGREAYTLFFKRSPK